MIGAVIAFTTGNWLLKFWNIRILQFLITRSYPPISRFAYIDLLHPPILCWSSHSNVSFSVHSCCRCCHVGLCLVRIAFLHLGIIFTRNHVVTTAYSMSLQISLLILTEMILKWGNRCPWPESSGQGPRACRVEYILPIALHYIAKELRQPTRTLYVRTPA